MHNCNNLPVFLVRGFSSRCFSSVVLPAPRKPLSTVTGTACLGFFPNGFSVDEARGSGCLEVDEGRGSGCLDGAGAAAALAFGLLLGGMQRWGAANGWEREAVLK